MDLQSYDMVESKTDVFAFVEPETLQDNEGQLNILSQNATKNAKVKIQCH